MAMDQYLRGFYEELEKIGSPWKTWATRAAVGAAPGALVGAAAGGEGNRFKGALTGAAIGGAGGAATGHLMQRHAISQMRKGLGARSAAAMAGPQAAHNAATAELKNLGGQMGSATGKTRKNLQKQIKNQYKTQQQHADVMDSVKNRYAQRMQSAEDTLSSQAFPRWKE